MKKLIVILASLGFVSTSFAHNHEEKNHESEKVIKVEINEDGFKPEKIKVEKGEELVLMVTRTTDKTCMKELKKPNGSGEVKLPLNKEVKFEVGKLEESGEIQILCGMDMKAGVVQVL